MFKTLIKSFKNTKANLYVGIIWFVHLMVLLVKTKSFLTPRLIRIQGFLNGQDHLTSKAGVVHSYQNVRYKSIRAILEKESITQKSLSRNQCREIHRAYIIAEHLLCSLPIGEATLAQARIMAEAIVKHERNYRRFDADSVFCTAELVLEFKLKFIKQLNKEKYLYGLMIVFLVFTKRFNVSMSDYDYNVIELICKLFFLENLLSKLIGLENGAHSIFSIDTYVEETTQKLLRNHSQAIAQFNIRDGAHFRIVDFVQQRLELLVNLPPVAPLAQQNNLVQDLVERRVLRYSNRNQQNSEPQSIKSKNRLERSRSQTPSKHGRSASSWR